jgi:hypothetical protein
MAFGDAGIPAINKIRGFDTPSCNRIAEEGTSSCYVKKQVKNVKYYI